MALLITTAVRTSNATSCLPHKPEYEHSAIFQRSSTIHLVYCMSEGPVTTPTVLLCVALLCLQVFPARFATSLHINTIISKLPSDNIRSRQLAPSIKKVQNFVNVKHLTDSRRTYGETERVLFPTAHYTRNCETGCIMNCWQAEYSVPVK
jgi:hypothetical protein